MKAVLEEDVEVLAKSLGIDSLIDAGHAECSICGESIDTYAQVFALYPLNSEDVGIVGRDPECVKSFALEVQRLGLL